MKDNQIAFIMEDGTEELATILFTHAENGKNYVVFEMNESGDVSAAEFIEEEAGEGQIIDIETDEEWDMIEKVLESYYDELEEVDDEEELFIKDDK